MSIPFLDLTRQNAELQPDLSGAIARVVSGGQFILGHEVEAFEAEWATFCGMRAAVAVGSGTDALSLALVASGAVRQGAGDEVIIPTLTAAYTGLAVLNAGGVPVFADVDEETYTIHPEAVEQAITDRTRAIVPVHLFGQMANMAALSALGKRHNLALIEDAAQAHGAVIDNWSPGEFKRTATFSFYPTKNLGAFGDGGAIVSDDADLVTTAKILRQGGHTQALAGQIAGRNSRLDEIQAAVLRVKLARLAEWNQTRKQLAGLYDELLSPANSLGRPVAPNPKEHVFHLYVVRHRERERLRRQLATRGIETMIHYPYLLHQQKLFHRPGQPPLLVAERLADQIFSLPLYPQLTLDELKTVANAILEYCDEGSLK